MVNQFILRKILEKWNLTPDFVTNGLLAVECFKKESFDIVFLDIQMPVMGGYEAAEKMRQLNPDVPIVAITAAVNFDSEEESSQHNLDGFIGKPYTPDQLLKCLMLAKKRD